MADAKTRSSPINEGLDSHKMLVYVSVQAMVAGNANVVAVLGHRNLSRREMLYPPTSVVYALVNKLNTQTGTAREVPVDSHALLKTNPYTTR